MTDAPKEIWLQIYPEGERYDSEQFGYDVTWCKDQINSNDVKYIRADLAAACQVDAERWRKYQARKAELLKQGFGKSPLRDNKEEP